MNLPYSVKAEASVLGSILLDPDSRYLIDLEADEFYVQKHKDIFRAAMGCEAPDIVTVAEGLDAKGLLEESGGIQYLSDLMGGTPNSKNIETYARTVSERATMRRGINLGQQVSQAGLDGDVSKMTDLLVSGMDVLANGQDSIWEPDESVARVIKHIDDVQNGHAPVGVPFGIQKLDQTYPGGMKPGNLVVLGARPSMGKSAVMQNIAMNTTCPVGIISLEMTADEIAQRGISMLSGIPYSQMDTASLSQQEWDEIGYASAEYRDRKIYVSDHGVSGMGDVARVAHIFKQRYKIGLLAIDYLQLLAAPGQSRYEAVSETSIALKQLAKKLGIPILLLSQLSRKCEERPDKRPMLSDLRESGQIEQDADAVIFLYRDAVYNDDAPENEMEIIVEKFRNGRIGGTVVGWDGPLMRLT